MEGWMEYVLSVKITKPLDGIVKSILSELLDFSFIQRLGLI
jgi:hypothetical protein